MNLILILCGASFLAAIVFWVFVWAGGIAAEPPASTAERRCWPADVKEDNGEYNGEYDD